MYAIGRQYLITKNVTMQRIRKFSQCCPSHPEQHRLQPLRVFLKLETSGGNELARSSSNMMNCDDNEKIFVPQR